MQYTGLLKRIIPFLLTFAVGLFVASFFVSIAFPSMRWEGRRVKRFYEVQQLREENRELRERNRVLRLQNEELQRQSQNWDSSADSIGDLPLIEDEHKPEPPPPPRKRRLDVMQ
jgi:hypothetical protein